MPCACRTSSHRPALPAVAAAAAGARRLPHAGAGRAGRAARLTARDSSRGGSGGSTSTDSVTAPQAGTEQHAAASPLPEIELEYVEPSGGQKAWTSFKLAFALPWRRFKKDSVLVLKLSGEIAEQPQVRLPAVPACLPSVGEGG